MIIVSPFPVQYLQIRIAIDLENLVHNKNNKVIICNNGIKRVAFPMFEYIAGPKIKLSDIKADC